MTFCRLSELILTRTNEKKSCMHPCRTVQRTMIAFVLTFLMLHGAIKRNYYLIVDLNELHTHTHKLTPQSLSSLKATTHTQTTTADIGKLCVNKYYQSSGFCYHHHPLHFHHLPWWRPGRNTWAAAVQIENGKNFFRTGRMCARNF